MGIYLNLKEGHFKCNSAKKNLKGICHYKHFVMLKLYLIRQDISREIEGNVKLKEPQLELAESNLVIFVVLMYCQGHKQE